MAGGGNFSPGETEEVTLKDANNGREAEKAQDNINRNDYCHHQYVGGCKKKADGGVHSDVLGYSINPGT